MVSFPFWELRFSARPAMMVSLPKRLYFGAARWRSLMRCSLVARRFLVLPDAVFQVPGNSLVIFLSVTSKSVYYLLRSNHTAVLLYKSLVSYL